MARKRRSVQATYDSLSAFVQHLDDTPNPLKGGWCSENDRPYEWNGNLTYKGAKKMALEGWSEKRELVQQTVAKVSADVMRRIEGLVPTLQYRVAGARPSVPRYLAGNPRHMVSYPMVPGSSNQRVVTIVVNGGALGEVQADTMIRRGVAIVALMSCLMQTGRSVEIWAEYSAENHSGADPEIAIRLKASSQTLDIDQLAFSLAHPAMFRRLLFAERERLCNQNGGMFASGPCRRADDLGATVVVDVVRGNNPPQVADPVGWIAETIESIANNEKVTS